MGIKFDAYATSRDAMNFVWECKTNVLWKGTISKVCDRAMAQAWRKMKDSGSAEEFDFAELSFKDPDDMTDAEIRWYVAQIERGMRRISNNLNARNRCKQRTNL